MVQEVAFGPTRPPTLAIGDARNAHGAWRRSRHDHTTTTPAGEAAIAHATRGEWEEAVVANRQLLELGPDIDACNRLGKALAELGRHAEALKAYEQALERDATNRIAQRNIERLRVLMAAKRPARTARAARRRHRSPSSSRRWARPAVRASSTWPPRACSRRSRRATRSRWTSAATSSSRSVGKTAIGSVEPRIATRLLKLIASGNRYDAAITTVHEAGGEVVIMIREVFTHPDNFGKVSFPTQGQAAVGVRPYMKGTALRYDDEDEVEEADEDSEEVEELDTTLPEYSGEPELEEELVEEP